MTTTAIRTRLHHFIDTIEDKKAAAIYTMFEDSINATENDYSDEIKAELDRRYGEYRQDGKLISRESMENRINTLTSYNL